MADNAAQARILLSEAETLLARATRMVAEAFAILAEDAPPAPPRQHAAVRTTSTQILRVLAEHGTPLTLVDIADGVAALRRSDDEPRKNGGTKYQEMCRSSLARMIEQGRIVRVPPPDRRGLMQFARS
jgi:hypothetical protein